MTVKSYSSLVATLARLGRAHREGAFELPASELRWLDKLSRMAESLPEDEAEFVAWMRRRIDPCKVRLEDYGI